MPYNTPASEEAINKTAIALKNNNFDSVIVETGQQALEKIKELIPRGASVMNGSSRTLQEIGFIEFLSSGQHGWDNLHAKILAETDKTKQAALRKQAELSDYYLGSSHAVTQDGQLMFASASGSQLPHLAFTSPNIILVVGAQKIVTDLKQGFQRIEEYVVPLEDARMKSTGAAGTLHAKTLILHKELTAMGRKILVIIAKEALGF